MKILGVYTLELSEREALDYLDELSEVEGYLAISPDQGNTRTGLAVMRKIRDTMAEHAAVFQGRRPVAALKSECPNGIPWCAIPAQDHPEGGHPPVGQLP